MAAAQIKGTFNIPNTPYKFVFGTVTFDSSYPTGGEAVPDLSTELDEVIAVFYEHNNTAAATVMLAAFYDRTNKKTIAAGGAAANTHLTEFTATKDLSAQAKLGFLAIGLKS